MVILFPLDLHIAIKLIIALFLLISLVVAWKKQPGHIGEAGVKTLVWQPDGSWLLESEDGQVFNAHLHESTYVHPWLVVLNFRVPGKRGLLSFPLAPDALDGETFRALRTRLKVSGVQQDDNLLN
ncbi:MAG TPA: hypothetical protein ENI97_02050 [Gammaproteobacteria bacterium]|nr:hypothetical protein [Gammaproteobacteria bacterium]